MKVIYIYIRKFFGPRALLVLCIALLGFCIFLYLGMYAHARFDDAYAVYAVESKKHNENAFLPGASGNPLRRELNKVLAEVLGKQMTAPERLALSNRGLLLLQGIERQIGAINDSSAAVQEALSDMDRQAQSFSNGYARGPMLEIVTLAKDELRFIEDIRGLSYRTNFHTAEIFNRVVADHGELTDAHIQELNDQLPKVEEQFNLRANLYTELERTSYKIEQIFHSLE